MRLYLRSGLIAGVASLAAVLGSCGGSDLEKVDADDWVADVCDEALDFEEDFFDLGADFQEALEDGDPGEIKEALGDFEDGAGDLIDEFVDAIEEVGEPDIDGGGDVIKAIREHADARKDFISDIRGEIDDLDDDDEDDFRDEAEEIFADADPPDLRDRLEDIDEGDVDDLIDQIDDEPGCGAVMFNS
jgi:hypothetical protein